MQLLTQLPLTKSFLCSRNAPKYTQIFKIFQDQQATPTNSSTFPHQTALIVSKYRSAYLTIFSMLLLFQFENPAKIDRSDCSTTGSMKKGINQ